MSAFVIDTETMTRCVRAICARGPYGQIVHNFDGIDTSRPEAPMWIGRRLFTLNIEAVTQRYPDCENDPNNLPGPCDDNGNSTAVGLGETYTPRLHGFDKRSRRTILCDGYKALRCLRYQCSEGDIPETPLYRELQSAIGEVAGAIIEGLPEFEKAAWG